jgi:hypothetical protein
MRISGFTRQLQGKFRCLSDKTKPSRSRAASPRKIALDVAQREVLGKDQYQIASKKDRRAAHRFAFAFGGNN